MSPSPLRRRSPQRILAVCAQDGGAAAVAANDVGRTDKGGRQVLRRTTVEAHDDATRRSLACASHCRKSVTLFVLAVTPATPAAVVAGKHCHRAPVVL